MRRAWLVSIALALDAGRHARCRDRFAIRRARRASLSRAVCEAVAIRKLDDHLLLSPPRVIFTARRCQYAAVRRSVN
jgi:hypothetical protein